MNYIKKLEKQTDDREVLIQKMVERIHLFKAHLNSDKFKGTDLDGERKDWISVNDVLAWLNTIEHVDMF